MDDDRAAATEVFPAKRLPLASGEKLIDFAEKWKPVLENNSREFEKKDFAEACWRCGFMYIINHPFCAEILKHPDSAISRIAVENDIFRMGCALFTVWRYLNHVDYFGLNQEQLDCFLALFDRIKFLAKKKMEKKPTQEANDGVNPMEHFDADRKRGLLWGLVIGDCLGSPIQFTGKDEHPYVTEMIFCRHFNTPPGYWTDDSAMAFCIMESVVRLKHYDLRDIAANFVRWYENGFWSSLDHSFDVGKATAAACVNIRDRRCLRNGFEESQGNGSIMRFAPTLFLDRGGEEGRISHEISDLTHDSTVVRDTIDRMMEICRSHLAGQKTGLVSEYGTREEVNNSGWAVSTLQAALWAFQSTDSFEEGMISAVNLGGDADSIGAVYGQIAGAYYGYSAIPARWLAAIKDREKIDKLISDFLAVAETLKR